MLKQISSLKNVNYFNKLGNYYDKSQRLKKLSGLISDEFLISKEKIEIASSICKVDLLSDIVNEFPELQGILGGYFVRQPLPCVLYRCCALCCGRLLNIF